MMGDIYARSCLTVVWLGTGAEAGVLGSFSCVKALRLEFFSRAGAAGLLDFDLEPLKALVSLPWFHRRWVLQEFVKALRVKFFLGSCDLDGDTFEFFGTEQWTTTAISCGIFRYDNVMGYLDTIRGMVTICTQYDPSKNVPIYELISATSQLECTDPRDRFYALLGISPYIGESDQRIQPNYSISPNELFKGFVS